MNPRPRPRPAVVAGGALLLALVAGGCVAPARSSEDYAGKAASSAEAVVSALRTAILGASVAADGRSFPPTISILLSEAEREALAARSSFASIQPPGPGSDRLRDELVSLLDEAVEGLAGLRIAARRAELDALPALAAPLRDLADELERFAQEGGS